jgi:hypothetical protein
LDTEHFVSNSQKQLVVMYSFPMSSKLMILTKVSWNQPAGAIPMLMANWRCLWRTSGITSSAILDAIALLRVELAMNGTPVPLRVLAIVYRGTGP